MIKSVIDVVTTKRIFYLSLLLILTFRLSAAPYSFDEVGNLIEKESLTETWKYRWTQGGMLKTVIRPDKRKVEFTYNALGRRLSNTYQDQDQTTNFVWDGNVPLHEWTSAKNESIFAVNHQLGKTTLSNNGVLSVAEVPDNLTPQIFQT